MREVRQSLSKTVRGNLLDQNIFVIGIIPSGSFDFLGNQKIIIHTFLT